MASLNKINYVDQDFSTAVTKIRNYLNTTYPDEFNDYVDANIGVALIDIIAYAEQNLLWYLNRKITDLYFPTAVTPRSISKLARLLGYKSAAATAAQVLVNITLPDGPYTFPVSITQNFQFQGPNNTIWEYRGATPVTFAPGETVKNDVELRQGQTVTNTFVSTGETSQFFELLSVPSGKFVEGASVEVTVDGEPWTEQPVIPFNTENNYETNLLAFPPIVRFGDGVQGAIPAVGAGIDVTYAITDGFRGRIVSQSITDPVVGLIAQFQDIPITIDQPSGSVGGDDPEDIRSIAVNAPLFQRTQDRAITKGDYDFLSNQFENVAKADAQIIRGVSGDIAFNETINNIILDVSGVADGIVDESVAALSGVNAAVSGIVDSTSSFVEDAKNIIDPYVNSISGKTDNIEATTNSQIATMRTDIGVDYDAATSALFDIDVESQTLIDTVGTVVDIKNASIGEVLDDIETAVAGDPLEPTVDALVAIVRSKLVEMKSETTAATTASYGTIDGKTDDVVTELNAILTEVESLSGEIEAATLTDRECIASDLGQICVGISSAASGYEDSITGYLETIVSGVAEINQIFFDQTSGFVDRISGYLDELLDHANEHLSSSCDANLVQVKVLAKDAARRYVAPLQSTLDSLKAYLEERKDVTHTVSTVEGTVDVVDAVVEIEARVSENALEDQVIANIKDALDKSDEEPLGILVEREFDQPLYIWEIDGAIRERISEEDIVFINIKIVGPSEYLDDDGNLVPPTGSVIQVGSVTVTALPRFTRTDGVNA